MIVIDSSGWLEFFLDGPLAGRYEKYLQPLSQVIVPGIVIYEVYKKIKLAKGEDLAVKALSLMQKGKVLGIDESLSLFAADISIRYQLAMADAFVYATSLQEEATLVTSDYDLKNLPKVVYLNKS